MDADSLEPLLEKLCHGDMAAAKQVFLAYEPYLRKVVRRQLPAGMQSKFDSIDIVQSVWAYLLTGYRDGAWEFPDIKRFQAFLVQVTRNRFNDRFRKHRIAFEKEQQLDAVDTEDIPPSPRPLPHDLVEAEELWDRMLALCPVEHQELLRLKRQGLTTDELVARTGLHPGSIRRILRNLAGKLALQQVPLTSGENP